MRRDAFRSAQALRCPPTGNFAQAPPLEPAPRADSGGKAARKAPFSLTFAPAFEMQRELRFVWLRHTIARRCAQALPGRATEAMSRQGEANRARRLPGMGGQGAVAIRQESQERSRETI